MREDEAIKGFNKLQELLNEAKNDMSPIVHLTDEIIEDMKNKLEKPIYKLVSISSIEFKAICEMKHKNNLLMKKEDSELFEAFMQHTAVSFGYKDWLQAWHNL